MMMNLLSVTIAKKIAKPRQQKYCELYLDEFRLELLRNIYMLLLKKGIQDGITQALKLYAKVNNKYMKDQYKSDEKSTYVKDLDANNLFEWAMIQKLPTNGFAWEKVKNFTPPPPPPPPKNNNNNNRQTCLKR